MQSHNDPELVRRFTAGEPAAFTALYQQYHFRIYQYAKRWLPDPQDAEDITADTFTKLWRRKERFTSLENISAFLFVTARNGCYDFLRHAQVKLHKEKDIELLLNAPVDGQLEEIREELMRLVYAEVEKMPKKMKEIFLLSYAEGLKPSEIARLLNLNVQTVSNQKTNAINLLRSALLNNPVFIALLLYSDNHSDGLRDTLMSILLTAA